MKEASGLHALKGIDLAIRRGDIFALHFRNGTCKMAMTSIVCGIVNASSGTVVDSHANVRDSAQHAR